MNEVSKPTPPIKVFELTPRAPATGAAQAIPVLRQYLRVAMRWRWVVAGCVAGCIALGLIATLLMTPKYTASTVVEIARESNKITDIQGVQSDASVADQEFYQTQYGLLRSRTLAERIATELKIGDDPKFFAMFGVPQKGAAFEQTDGRYPASGREERARAAGEVLLRNVDVSPTRLSRLVQIDFTSADPAFSAKVANAWANSFIQITLERRYQATSYARKFLEGRLEQLRVKLEDSERQLVTYAGAQKIINLPGVTASDGTRLPDRSIDVDDLVTLNNALAQATADRIQAEARFQQSKRGGVSAEQLRNEAINQLRQKRAELAAEYQRLMVQFEPGYPAAKAIAAQIAQLDKSIGREEGRADSSIADDYKAALSRENQLKGKVDALKGDMLDLRRRSIQYNIFQREVDTNRQLYDGLLQRYKEIGVAGGVGVNNVSVVDSAEVPAKPSSPRLVLNLFLSLLGGLALGAMAAFALEQIDEAIADPEEVERELGLPLLGAIPKSMDDDLRQALSDRKSNLVEAYLAVQTNLQFSTEHGVPRSLAVTSTRPAEGKSTTALALATMLSRSGRRVVLVDGDMRSPSVHHFAGAANVKGLSNYLAGSDDIASLLIQIPDLQIAAMSAGPLPPNAAELLTGERLGKLVGELGHMFDHIVIDSPPIMGLADAPLICSRVEAAVYVVESHGIRTSLVRTALARLASANAHVIGGVLTKFESKRAHYGYGYEYGYGYGRDARAEAKERTGR
ncbi:MAG: polysaccharide biosynthesis tyrosine autokinase [Sphingomonas sp.]|uniref:GumC family protein n=1 Tax=Sphingomonas sp. TaxID=28214 RepID=UPI001ACAFCBB|nr:polysaccharide biosynthesis tyrosine autokinase [Sphingomonas sp.]MBN8816717.1 polysaccharide biosynthesis tyrosine autokinase [Sphingomonas sp.]